MKKLRYIFLLLIAVLSGFAISSCEDDDVVAAEVTEEAAEGSGETVKTTFTISLSAPDVSADLDPVTRAGDNANIEYAKPENGGRFQNIVVVLVDNNDKIKGVHCHNWGDNVGVKEYNVIFSDIEVPATGVDYKVYAFGNVCEDHYKELKKDTSSIINKNLSNDRVKGWPNIFSYCVNAVISVGDPYKITFKPGETYKVGLFVNSAVSVTSTGMPVNNSATAKVQKGNTQFNVALKRVCARLQVTFRNFTGTYKDYETNEDKPNNVYVDKFDLKGILATSTNYFYSSSNKLTTSTEDFDILQALGGSKTNDHIINKVENGKDLVVSMYVFENNKGGYQYDLKVDRGKSLGLNTTVIDTANAYVIWNNTKHNSIAYKGGKICASREQTSKDNIPFSDQVFWKLENPICETKLSGEKIYMLRHFQINIDNDMYVDNGKVYLKQQTAPNWGWSAPYEDIDGIPADNNEEYQESYTEWWQTKYRTVHNDVQYIHFKLDNPNAKESKYTMNLMKTHDQENDYWEKAIGLFYRYNLLTVSDDDKLSKQRSEIQLSGRLGNYDWTLYAKYIIKNGETFKDKAGAITQIERNHSYELDFSVMPNYDTKQEILVNCVRKQNEINWSEVEK